MLNYDENNPEDKKLIFLDYIKDAVSDAFYYNRKNDEELSVEDVKMLISEKKISLKAIVATFTEKILENFPDIQK